MRTTYREILLEWTYGIESDFMLNGTPASWGPGQPVLWGDEARKIELDDKAYDCSVSADEKFLALAIGRQVRIYNLENLELIEALNGHPENVRRVKFFPLDIAGNKYKLVSSSNSNRDLDAMVIVWTLDKHGKNTSKHTDSVVSRADASHIIQDNLVFTGELTGFGSSAVSNDGKLLVYVSDNHESRLSTATTWGPKVVVYDIEMGEKRLTLEGHTDSIMCMTFSPDNKIVASVCWDQMVKLWDTSTGRLVHDIGPTGGQNWTGDFSPDSKYFAFTRGSPSTVVYVHSVLDGTRIFESRVSTPWLRSLAWSHDGHHLAAGGVSGVVYIWNPHRGEQEQKWQLKGGERHHGMFSETGWVQWLDSKGMMLAYKGTEGGVNVYDMLENQKWRSDPKKSDLANLPEIKSGSSLHYLRKANQLISMDMDQTVRFWVVN
ncbi:WD40-repeat-containing domain protein [Lipomyces orientalis]|uniref:WD40-repeat-containing domain protein n=1 Tax=Lipomyces orientalis TaxID=1233043 RepID=A0ACC3TL47_9ASCO